MKKAIVVFEVEGGSDKFIDGHRKDTMPIVNAIKAEGWDAEVVYYRPEWSEKLFEYVSENFDAYISRVNPGNIPGGEKGLLRTPDQACRRRPGRHVHPRRDDGIRRQRCAGQTQRHLPGTR